MQEYNNGYEGFVCVQFTYVTFIRCSMNCICFVWVKCDDSSVVTISMTFISSVHSKCDKCTFNTYIHTYKYIIWVCCILFQYMCIDAQSEFFIWGRYRYHLEISKDFQHIMDYWKCRASYIFIKDCFIMHIVQYIQ